jgi:hypothetical protein
MVNKLLFLTIISLFFLPVTVFSECPKYRGHIVKFNRSLNNIALNLLAESVKFRPINKIENIYLVSGLDNSGLTILSNDNNVDSISPNCLRTLPKNVVTPTLADLPLTPPIPLPEFYPNDPYVPNQWGFYSYGIAGSKIGTDVNILPLWRSGKLGRELIEPASDAPIVAIIDSGLKLGLTDLEGRYVINTGEIENNNKDDDGNGYIDDYIGWDATSSDSGVRAGSGLAITTDNESNHGTWVNSIINAKAGNGTGTTGIFPGAKALHLNVFKPRFLANGEEVVEAEDADIIASIDYILAAKRRGLPIKSLNMSLGGAPRDPVTNEIIQEPCPEIYQEKFAEVEQAGIVSVVAAGNSIPSVNLDEALNFPSSCKVVASTMLVVGAHRSNGAFADFSLYGSKIVDISAPGVDIVVQPSEAGSRFSIQRVDGTSFSAPYVAGAVALLAYIYPEISIKDIRNAIVSGAKKVSGFDKLVIAGGQLDIFGSATKLENLPVPVPITTPTVIPTPEPTISTGIKVLNFRARATFYKEFGSLKISRISFSNTSNVKSVAINTNIPFNPETKVSSLLRFRNSLGGYYKGTLRFKYKKVVEFNERIWNVGLVITRQDGVVENRTIPVLISNKT